MGNLRTAWWASHLARKSKRAFYLRIEDIDTQRCKAEYAKTQIEDLKALGITFDGEILYQSQRYDAYRQALSQLTDQGMVYECYCSRADIRSAASAPHSRGKQYPGTCRNLSQEERENARHRLSQQGRRPTMRLRAPWQANNEPIEKTIKDQRLGLITTHIEDVVLWRSDADPAYNLAVVVDDIYQGIDQVVRGEDLAELSPTQAFLTQALGGQVPEYIHVPLWLGSDGKRLSKREGAVTRRELNALGVSDEQIMSRIMHSIKDSCS